MLDPVFSWIETVIVDKVALSSSSRILYIIMINGFLHTSTIWRNQNKNQSVTRQVFEKVSFYLKLKIVYFIGGYECDDWLTANSRVSLAVVRLAQDASSSTADQGTFGPMWLIGSTIASIATPAENSLTLDGSKLVTASGVKWTRDILRNVGGSGTPYQFESILGIRLTQEIILRMS